MLRKNDASDRADWLPVGDGLLWLGVGRRGDGFAVEHAGALEDVVDVLSLRQEEAVTGAMHINTEEVGEGSHVLDGECRLELVDDVAEKGR